MKEEEDEWIMLHVGLSQLIMFFFPLGGPVLNELVFFDYQGSDSTPGEVTPFLPLPRRDDIFSYYRNCVKRHLYYHRRYNFKKNENIAYLSKNPAFTMRLYTIYRHFPDARVVCLLRDPIQSIPSMISYISLVC